MRIPKRMLEEGVCLTAIFVVFTAVYTYLFVDISLFAVRAEDFPLLRTILGDIVRHLGTNAEW